MIDFQGRLSAESLMGKRATKCVSFPQRPDCAGLVFRVFFSFRQPRRSQKQGQWLEEEEEARAGVLMEALLHTAQPSAEARTSHGKERLYPSMKFGSLLGWMF